MQKEVSILFQDNHLIVAFKPYGALSEYDEKKPNMPAVLKEETGCDAIYPVHRLDRTTQGLMVYAKTEEAARRLSRLIQDGGLENFDRKKNKSYVVKRERKGVKQARLSYETIATSEYDAKTLSLLKIRLLTGRTHQIRVQFASRKMPLVGDRRYGSSVTSDNIMLCSHRLRFTHPFSGEEMDFLYRPEDGVFALFEI